MLEPFRSDFNARFTPEKYRLLLARLEQQTRTKLQFPVSETPCFFPRSLMEQMAEIGSELIHQLVDDPDYMAISDQAVPERFRVPNEPPHPHFVVVDFGLVRNEQGDLEPKLVELQAFPSLFGYQSVLSTLCQKVYQLDPALDCFFNGLEEHGYWEMLRQVIVGNHAPEEVILVEVTPEKQKTLPDFRVYEDRLGITTVDISSLRKEGNRLFYRREGRWTPVRRVFNRAIVEEIERKQIRLNFDYRDDLEIEWAGHPNGYFRISKFSLPFLQHRAVPATAFLADWFAGKKSEHLPEETKRMILKPLYSFAGQGIQFAPSLEDLRAIPEDQRHLYLLQERLFFEPVIRTPEGMTQAEARILYTWPDKSKLIPSINLIRMGRGQMMGVDHNRNLGWVGSSVGLF